MRLFGLSTLIHLLATGLLVGALASPIHEQNATAHVQDNGKLEQRASPYAVELALFGQAPNTFTGIKPLSGVFSFAFQDHQVQTAAKATFDLWDDRQIKRGQPSQSLLVAVIAIPGYGLAAGTIWHGGDEAFAQYLKDEAPKLWTLCQLQGRRPGLGRSIWHAEIVASWVAEGGFPGVKVGSKWPTGTKIAIYSREKLPGSEDKVVGYKPVYEAGATSNKIPCSTLMQAQGIIIVNP